MLVSSQEHPTHGLAVGFRFEKRDASIWWGEVISRPHILIIDDDRALSNLLAFVMRHEGFEVDATNDGDTGIGAGSIARARNREATAANKAGTAPTFTR